MKHRAAPETGYAAKLLDRAKGNPELFQRVMRMYEVCGSNTDRLRKETQRLYDEVTGRR